MARDHQNVRVAHQRPSEANEELVDGIGGLHDALLLLVVGPVVFRERGHVVRILDPESIRERRAGLLQDPWRVEGGD